MIRLAVPLTALMIGLGCSDPTVAPPTPPVKPTEPPPATVFDEAGCRAKLGGGEEIGVWRAQLEGGNRLEVHLAVPPGTPKPDALTPDTPLVAWAKLDGTDLEKLVDLPTQTNVPDPGPLCLASLGADDQLKPGKVYKDERTDKNVALLLTAPLSASEASAFWTHPEVAPAAQPIDPTKPEGGLSTSRLVPGYDKRADGRTYLLVRLGETGGHGHPIALTGGNRLAGDAVISLVNERGEAIFDTHAVR